MNILIGDRLGEKFPSFVRGGKGKYLDTYKVVGFEDKTYGRFAKTIRERNGDEVGIDIELLKDDVFYEKLKSNHFQD